MASSAVASLLMALAEERSFSEFRMSDMTMTLLIGAVYTSLVSAVAHALVQMTIFDRRRVRVGVHRGLVSSIEL